MIKLIDCHNDFLTEFKTLKEKIKYIKSLKNVKMLCCAIFTTERKLGLKEINRLKNEMYILQTYTKIKLLLTIEDIGFVNNVDSLNELIKIRPFAVTLCWNNKNSLCGGALSSGGLSEWGKFVVCKLEKNNILIDTAHMNNKSFNDFIKITTKPVFNSHSNIFELFNNKRNLHDYQIRQIINSNGFLGITIYKNFISNKYITSLEIAKQFKYLIDKYGFKNIGFGTDFYGIKTLPKDIDNYCDLNKIKIHLKNFGFKNNIIKNIFNKNFIKFKKKLKKYLKNTNKNAKND